MIDHRAGVYQIVDWLKGRQYVGSAIDFHPRWLFHWSQLRRGIHHSPYLQRVYDKHGPDNLSIEILEIVEIPNGWDSRQADELLRSREQWWMDVCEPVFNSCPTAGSPLGFKHTEETLEKFKTRKRRGPVSDEEKTAISARSKGHQYGVGRVRTEESKAKTSAALKGKSKSPEHVAKMIGHIVTQETRAKISESRKGQKASEATRKKMSESQTGRKHSEETKSKISASNMGRSNSPESIEQAAAKNRGRKRTPEQRAALSKAAKHRKPLSPEGRANVSAAAYEREEKKRLARQAEQQSLEGMNGDSHPVEEEST